MFIRLILVIYHIIVIIYFRIVNTSIVALIYVCAFIILHLVSIFLIRLYVKIIRIIITDVLVNINIMTFPLFWKISCIIHIKCFIRIITCVVIWIRISWVKLLKLQSSHSTIIINLRINKWTNRLCILFKLVIIMVI